MSPTSSAPQHDGSGAILIYSPNALYGFALKEVVDAAPDLHVIEVLSGSADIVAAAERLRPQVLLLGTESLSLQKLTHLVRALNERGLEVRVLLLSDGIELEPEAAVLAGAWGQLGHNTPPEMLIKALRAVAGGEVWVSRRLQARLLGRFLAKPAKERPALRPLLSEREVEILRGFAADKETVDIADELHIEIATVKSHLNRIYRKLGVSNRDAAIAAAIRAGFTLEPHGDGSS